VLDGVVSGIEVVSECRKLGCDCVNLFDEWGNAMFFAQAANCELVRADTQCQLTIREAKLLRMAKELRAYARNIQRPYDRAHT
jgi:hypothetical protein